MRKIYSHFYVRSIVWIKRLGIWLLPKNSQYQKFVILCSARTGSTWLHTLLNSHLNVYSHGEIKASHNNSELFLEEFAFAKYPSFIRAVGLKVFYDLPDHKKILQDILQSDIKVILLTRQSLIEQFTSLKKATVSNQWSDTRGSRTWQLKLDVDEYTSFKKNSEAELDSLKESLTNKEVFSILYEDLVAQQAVILDELQKFLGVTPKKLRSLLEKQSSTSISLQIENWEEIKNQL